jgi:hypothetical protein
VLKGAKPESDAQTFEPDRRDAVLLGVAGATGSVGAISETRSGSGARATIDPTLSTGFSGCGMGGGVGGSAPAVPRGGSSSMNFGNVRGSAMGSRDATWVEHGQGRRWQPRARRCVAIPD